MQIARNRVDFAARHDEVDWEVPASPPLYSEDETWDELGARVERQLADVFPEAMVNFGEDGQGWVFHSNIYPRRVYDLTVQTSR